MHVARLGNFVDVSRKNFGASWHLEVALDALLLRSALAGVARCES